MSDATSKAEIKPAPPESPAATSTATSEKKGFLQNWGGAIANGVTVITLATGAYTIGHNAGVSDGSIQAQAQISDLRDKVRNETTAATISQNNEATAKASLKVWQDSYNKLLEADKELATENSSLKEQIKQLDPCAYMEKEIDSLNDSIRWRPLQNAIDQRDSIQAQLSTCRH